MSEDATRAGSDRPYDVKRELRAFYAPKGDEFALVDVPDQRFLAVDGTGDPNTAIEYRAAVEALFSVAYTIKFTSKRELGRDLVVAPLEALWWADDPAVFVRREKEAWSWTALIAQPDWIDAAEVARAVEAVAAKRAKAKPGADDVDPAVAASALESLRLEQRSEGCCAQILHLGPYDDEGPTLARLHDDFLPAHGLTFNGPHHEVYLSDVRRTAPEKLKTILRQPVRPL